MSSSSERLSMDWNHGDDKVDATIDEYVFQEDNRNGEQIPSPSDKQDQTEAVNDKRKASTSKEKPNSAKKTRDEIQQRSRSYSTYGRRRSPSRQRYRHKSDKSEVKHSNTSKNRYGRERSPKRGTRSPPRKQYNSGGYNNRQYNRPTNQTSSQPTSRPENRPPAQRVSRSAHPQASAHPTPNIHDRIGSHEEQSFPEDYLKMIDPDSEDHYVVLDYKIPSDILAKARGLIKFITMPNANQKELTDTVMNLINKSTPSKQTYITGAIFQRNFKTLGREGVAAIATRLTDHILDNREAKRGLHTVHLTLATIQYLPSMENLWSDIWRTNIFLKQKTVALGMVPLNMTKWLTRSAKEDVKEIEMKGTMFEEFLNKTGLGTTLSQAGMIKTTDGIIRHHTKGVRNSNTAGDITEVMLKPITETRGYQDNPNFPNANRWLATHMGNMAGLIAKRELDNQRRDLEKHRRKDIDNQRGEKAKPQPEQERYVPNSPSPQPENWMVEMSNKIIDKQDKIREAKSVNRSPASRGARRGAQVSASYRYTSPTRRTRTPPSPTRRERTPSPSPSSTSSRSTSPARAESQEKVYEDFHVTVNNDTMQKKQMVNATVEMEANLPTTNDITDKEKIQNLEAELANTKNKLVQAKARFGSLSANVTQYQQMIKDFEEQTTILQKEDQAKGKKIEQMENQYRRDKEALEDATRKMKRAKEDLREEQEERERECARHECENKYLRDDLTKTTQELKIQKELTASIKKQKENLEKKNRERK